MTALRVLHVDGGHDWGGGQNQVRLLMHELARENVEQLCICPAGSALAKRLKQERLPVRAVGWRGGADPRVFFAIMRALRRFDIVHTHDAHALQLALLPARMRGVPLVASRRTRFKTNAAKWNRAQSVVAISNSVREVLVASGVHENRIRVIHSGIDIEESRAIAPMSPALREQLRIARDAFVVGNAGHFFEAKGQVLIPEAAARPRSVFWVIAGEGPQRAAIEDAIARNGVHDRVFLLGWLPDARALLREADAFVSAAVDEALGTTILDAMACGIPVVAANIGGPPEILAPVHAATGAVLFEPRNANALAALVERIRLEPALRAAIVNAQNARLQDFTIARTAAQTLALYRELA